MLGSAVVTMATGFTSGPGRGRLVGNWLPWVEIGRGFGLSRGGGGGGRDLWVGRVLGRCLLASGNGMNAKSEWSDD